MPSVGQTVTVKHYAIDGGWVDTSATVTEVAAYQSRLSQGPITLVTLNTGARVPEAWFTGSTLYMDRLVPDEMYVLPVTVADHAARITAAEATIVSTTANVASLTSNVSSIVTRLNKVDGGSVLVGANLVSRVATLETASSGASGDISTIQTDVTNLQGNVTSLDARLDKVDGGTILTGTNLVTRVANIESRLAAAGIP